jgi:hypothetical protein
LPGYDPEKLLFYAIRNLLFSAYAQSSSPTDGMERQMSFGSVILQVLYPIAIIGSSEITLLDSSLSPDGFL